MSKAVVNIKTIVISRLDQAMKDEMAAPHCDCKGCMLTRCEAETRFLVLQALLNDIVDLEAKPEAQFDADNVFWAAESDDPRDNKEMV